MGDAIETRNLKRKRTVLSIPTRDLKQINFKREESDEPKDTSTLRTSKRPSRGVIQKPYPPCCYPTAPNCIVNRENFKEEVARRLAAVGKRVLSIRFFEPPDDVAIDWLLDNSLKLRPTAATLGSQDSPINIESSDTAADNSSNSESSDSDQSDNESEVSSSSSSSSQSSQQRRTFSFRARTAPMATPEVQTENILIPKVKYGRPRRLLLRSNEFPLVTVSMSGDLQFIDKASKKRIPKLSLPSGSNRGENVQDAVSASDLIVLGRKGGTGQLQLVYQAKPDRAPKMTTPVTRTPHKDGINCLSSIEAPSSSKYHFYSGGLDKTVVRWSIDRERKGTFKSTFTALPQRHKARISALASRTHTLLSASSKNLIMEDVRGEAEVISAKFGVDIHQIHLHPTDHNVIIFEVADLDDQVRVYDIRVGLRGRPRMEFGRRDHSNGKLVSSDLRRGETSEQYFVRGFEDGLICTWDYRHPNPTAIRISQAEHPVWHTVFDSSANTIWSFASNVIGYHTVHF